MAHTAVDIYPPLGLVGRTKRLELRLVNGFEEAAALADVAAAGVHDPSFMPFASPWTDGTPEQVRARVLAHALSLYPCETPNVWKLPFAVRESGNPRLPIGVMSLISRDQQGAEAVTGSWLGKEYQGRGYGNSDSTLRATGTFAAASALSAFRESIAL